MPYQCFWYSCLVDSFHIQMIMMMITLMISIIILLMINMIICIYVQFHFFHHISHVFRHELVYCVILCFGMKTTMKICFGKDAYHCNVCRKVYTTKKALCAHRKRTIQMMYVMLYFCIVCKLYEFLTYIMYIWTKNVSWFTWYCPLL